MLLVWYKSALFANKKSNMFCRSLLLLLVCTLVSCFDVRFREDLYLAKDGSGRVVVNAEFDESVQTKVRQSLDKYYKAACEVKGIGINDFNIKAIGNRRAHLHIDLTYNNYRDLYELSEQLGAKQPAQSGEGSSEKKSASFRGIFPGEFGYEFDGLSQVRVQRLIDPAVLVQMIEANNSMQLFVKNPRPLDMQLDYYVHAPYVLQNNANEIDAKDGSMHWNYRIGKDSSMQKQHFNVYTWYMLPSWIRGLVYGAATGMLLAGLHIARRKWEKSRRLANPRKLAAK